MPIAGRDLLSVPPPRGQLRKGVTKYSLNHVGPPLPVGQRGCPLGRSENQAMSAIKPGTPSPIRTARATTSTASLHVR
jgi:hypothetical protein